MSRSILRNRFIRSIYKGNSLFVAKADREVHNPHRQDEMPKNCPSRLVMNNCSADVDWLQNSTSFGGHSRPKGGHRRVSGLVRASLKRKARRLIEEQLDEARKAAKITTCLLLMCLAGTLNAADMFRIEKERSVGFKGGINFTSTGVVATDLKEFNVMNYIGWHAGMSFRFNLPQGFSLQPEVFYRQSGSQLQDTDSGTTYKIEEGSVFIPLELQWGPRISIFRPYISGHLGANFPVTGKIGGQDMKKSFNDMTFCYGFGVGVEIWKFVLSWRYNWTTGQFKGEAVEAMPALKNAGLCGYDLSIAILF